MCIQRTKGSCSLCPLRRLSLQKTKIRSDRSFMSRNLILLEISIDMTLNLSLINTFVFFTMTLILLANQTLKIDTLYRIYTLFTFQCQFHYCVKLKLIPNRVLLNLNLNRVRQLREMFKVKFYSI